MQILLSSVNFILFLSFWATLAAKNSRESKRKYFFLIHFRSPATSFLLACTVWGRAHENLEQPSLYPVLLLTALLAPFLSAGNGLRGRWQPSHWALWAWVLPLIPWPKLELNTETHNELCTFWITPVATDPSTQLGCAKVLGPQRDSPAGTQQARPQGRDGEKMERGVRETVEERKCESEGKRK